MYVRVCLCVSSLYLCELVFAGYRTSYWQVIENSWLRNGKGDSTTNMSPALCCCVCPLSTLQQMVKDKSLQWLSCCCMQLDTTQKKFTLQEATLKVKIEDGQIQEISVSVCEPDSFPPCE